VSVFSFLFLIITSGQFAATSIIIIIITLYGRVISKFRQIRVWKRQQRGEGKHFFLRQMARNRIIQAAVTNFGLNLTPPPPPPPQYISDIEQNQKHKKYQI